MLVFALWVALGLECGEEDVDNLGLPHRVTRRKRLVERRDLALQDELPELRVGDPVRRRSRCLPQGPPPFAFVASNIAFTSAEMCAPVIRFSGGRIDASCGIETPASTRPLRTAKTRPPFVGMWRPMSRIPEVAPFATARRPASSPVRYAAGTFPVDAVHPSFLRSRPTADATTRAPPSVYSTTCTTIDMFVFRR